MSVQSQGPGWWLANDGRYYPPEQHGSVVTEVAPDQGAPAARRPVWRRPWFWILVAGAAVLLGCAALIAVVAAIGGGSSDALVPIRSMDYSTAADDEPVVDGDATSQVVDGVLVLTHDADGPAYIALTHAGPASGLGFQADVGWSDPAAGGYLGVMVLNPAAEGYGVTCSTDGTAVVWAIGIETTASLGSSSGTGCTAGSNALSVAVVPGGASDAVTVTFPDGSTELYLPGTRLGPFDSGGVMSLPPVSDQPAPVALVGGYTLLGSA